MRPIRGTLSAPLVLTIIGLGAFVTALAATAGYLALRWARAKFG